jgi:hypothetical protein
MARTRGAGAAAGKAAAGILKPVIGQLRRSKRLKTAGKTAIAKPAAPAAGSGRIAKSVIVDGKKYPESAKHIRDAQAAGHPKVLTIHRPGTKGNRKASLKGIPTKPRKDRDEYPPAMFKEGGAGASVRHIASSDNQGAGASIGNQVRGLPNGARVQIIPR